MEDKQELAINIEQTLPALACDFDGLKQWARAMTAKYDNLVISENQVTDIKKDMAVLNKAKDKLNRARIDAVKTVSAPIKEFETQIKQICAIFETAYDNLAWQVREFEDAQKEEKRKKIKAMIEEEIAIALSDYPEMEGKIALSVNERWLNKTMTMKSVGIEIDAAITAQVKANLEVARLEKAEAERRMLIESAVKAANEKHNLTLFVAHFMDARNTSLDTEASQVLENINKEVELALAARERNDESHDDGVKQDKNPTKALPDGLNWGEIPRHEFNKVEEHTFITASPEYEIHGVYCKNGEPLEDYLPKPNATRLSLEVVYPPEQEEAVRQILEQNHFMRIVRQLRGIGVKCEFNKEEA